MFEFGLKKYKIVKSFGCYQAGQLVAFNGADAERFKDFICADKQAVKEMPAKPQNKGGGRANNKGKK